MHKKSQNLIKLNTKRLKSQKDNANIYSIPTKPYYANIEQILKQPHIFQDNAQ